MSDPAASEGLTGPLIHRCQQCKGPGAGEKLLRCRYCRAVRYCSIEHLRADRPSHNSTCKGIKKARVKLAKEERVVRNLPANDGMPANVFETEVGFFRNFPRTRDYMKARYILAGRLYMLGTLDSTAQALRHMEDMMRLDMVDDINVQIVVPYVMLCLDLDQESCDFIKGWGIPGREIVEGTDIFESAGSILGEAPLLDHAVACLLLRLKLLVDVISVMNARKVLSLTPLPVEIQNIIEKNVVRSPLSAHLYKESTQALVEIQGKIVRGVLELGSFLTVNNKNFMSKLFDVDKPFSVELPERRWLDPTSLKKAAIMARHSYPAWRGTEGVLQLLGHAATCAAMSTHMNIKGLFYSAGHHLGKISRSATELLRDESLEAIWQFLEWAVQDATYLGPPAERPSERYRKLDHEILCKYVEEFLENEQLDVMRQVAQKSFYRAEGDEGSSDEGFGEGGPSYEAPGNEDCE